MTIDRRYNPLARNPRLPEASTAIKRWARSALGLSDEHAVTVSEIACSVPGCPPQETVVLILPTAGGALKLSIHKAVLNVTEEDVRKAAETTLDVLNPIAPIGL